MPIPQVNPRNSSDEDLNAFKQKKEKQFKDGKSDQLKKELTDLEAYLEGCRRSEISDTFENIKFKHNQVDIIKQILIP